MCGLACIIIIIILCTARSIIIDTLFRGEINFFFISVASCGRVNYLRLKYTQYVNEDADFSNLLRNVEL